MRVRASACVHVYTVHACVHLVHAHVCACVQLKSQPQHGLHVVMLMVSTITSLIICL